MNWSISPMTCGRGLRGVDDHDVVGRHAAQVRPPRPERPAGTRTSGPPSGVAEPSSSNRSEQLARRRRCPKPLAVDERQLEEAGLQVPGEEQEVVGVDQALLRTRAPGSTPGWRTMNWSSGELDATKTPIRSRAAARTAELLPRRGDRARVADEHRRLEGADVDAELQRVGARRRPCTSPARRPASISRRCSGR